MPGEEAREVKEAEKLATEAEESAKYHRLRAKEIGEK